MDIHEALIRKYAKKIVGFAYSKTHDYHEAQDLSQNIALALCKTDFSANPIADMDGYIYRVCQYTWSNFVRANMPFWKGTGFIEELESIRTADSVEDQILETELYQKLRREILYLGKNKREATILFYFDNMSGREIAERLGVPASTVRWYLGESKKILRERMEMTDTIYTPKRLTVYFNGNSNTPGLGGLRDDLLAQNICLVCEKKPLTIEEISSTLGMAAAFIENKLDPLIYMNYIEKVGANKYKTTFYIQDAAFFTAKKQFEAAHIPPVAHAIYTAVQRNLPKIRDIGFCGCTLNDNFLLWTFITAAAHAYENRSSVPCHAEPPLRGDGSRHWIDACWQIDEIFSTCGDLEPDFRDYMRYSDGAAGKHSGNEQITMLQFDPPIAGGDRAAWMSPELGNLRRIYTIIREKLSPNEHDKELIALLAEKGYVSVTDGVPAILIPYFTSEEYDAFTAILDREILPEVEAAAGTGLMRDYAAFIRKKIPAYLSDSEKAFLASRFYQPNAFTYLLFKDGLLAAPTQKEAKRICTMVWER